MELVFQLHFGEVLRSTRAKGTEPELAQRKPPGKRSCFTQYRFLRYFIQKLKRPDTKVSRRFKSLLQQLHHRKIILFIIRKIEAAADAHIHQLAGHHATVLEIRVQLVDIVRIEHQRRRAQIQLR